MKRWWPSATQLRSLIDVVRRKEMLLDAAAELVVANARVRAGVGAGVRGRGPVWSGKC